MHFCTHLHSPQILCSFAINSLVMWPTSTSRLERTDWWDKQLKSVRILERVKTRYRSQYNANATIGNRAFRTFFADKKPRIDVKDGVYNNVKQPNTNDSFCDDTSYFFRNSSRVSLPSRATNADSAKSSKSRITVDSELLIIGKKVIRISGICKGMCVPSIVAQLSGGGLEKIIYHEKENWLEVYFLSTVRATQFLNYSRDTGLFVVNGMPLVVEWSTSLEARTCESTPLPNHMIEEIELSKASRVLILSKTIPGKSEETSSKRVYPNPRANFSEEFGIEAVKWDFIAFGGIVEVSPMISLKLSVSIQFTDIRSSLLAMRSMKQRNSTLRSKYSHWSLQYGKDPAQRPCYAV